MDEFLAYLPPAALIIFCAKSCFHNAQQCWYRIYHYFSSDTRSAKSTQLHQSPNSRSVIYLFPCFWPSGGSKVSSVGFSWLVSRLWRCLFAARRSGRGAWKEERAQNDIQIVAAQTRRKTTKEVVALAAVSHKFVSFSCLLTRLRTWPLQKEFATQR